MFAPGLFHSIRWRCSLAQTRALISAAVHVHDRCPERGMLRAGIGSDHLFQSMTSNRLLKSSFQRIGFGCVSAQSACIAGITSEFRSSLTADYFDSTIAKTTSIMVWCAGGDALRTEVQKQDRRGKLAIAVSYQLSRNFQYLRRRQFIGLGFRHGLFFRGCHTKMTFEHTTEIRDVIKAT